MATIVNITDSGWSVFVNASKFDALLDFEFQLDSEGPIDAPTDFTLSGTATNSLQDYLATSGVKYVQNLQVPLTALTPAATLTLPPALFRTLTFVDITLASGIHDMSHRQRQSELTLTLTLPS